MDVSGRIGGEDCGAVEEKNYDIKIIYASYNKIYFRFCFGWTADFFTGIERTCDGDNAGQDLDNVRGHGGGHHINIIGHAADDITGLIAVKIADRKCCQLLSQ